MFLFVFISFFFLRKKAEYFISNFGNFSRKAFRFRKKLYLLQYFDNPGCHYEASGGFWPHDASRTRIVTFFFNHDAYSHLFKNLATRVVKFFSQRWYLKGFFNFLLRSQNSSDCHSSRTMMAKYQWCNWWWLYLNFKIIPGLLSFEDKNTVFQIVLFVLIF